MKKIFIQLTGIFLAAFLVSCGGGGSSGGGGGSGGDTDNNNLIWTQQLGGGASTTTTGFGISVDSSGNSYVTGSTESAISDDGLQGLKDYFVAMYNSAGNLQWIHQVGGTNGNATGTGIAIDLSGNSYIVGHTDVALSGGAQTGGDDYFVAKYGPTGNLIWTKQVGAPGGATEGNAISVDAVGNVYIVGVTNMGISGQTQLGQIDSFIAKYDTNGNLIWTTQFGVAGGTAEVNAHGIKSDADGNLYIDGGTTAALAGQTQTGLTDYFVAKYTTDGAFVWNRQAGGSGGMAIGWAIGVDDIGNSYIAGTTSVSLESGVAQQGGFDYFMAKYDTDGNLLLTNQVGASGGNTGVQSVAVGTDHVYITGFTTVGISGQTQQGIIDYFIAKYTLAGSLVWTVQTGNIGQPYFSLGIAVDADENSYITGLTAIAAESSTDYFVSKYGK